MGCSSPKATNIASEPQAHAPGIHNGSSSSSKAPAKMEAWSGVMAQETGTAVPQQTAPSLQEQIISAIAPTENKSGAVSASDSQEKEDKVLEVVAIVKKGRRRSDGNLLAVASLEPEETPVLTTPKRRASLESKSSLGSGLGFDEKPSPTKTRRSSVGAVPSIEQGLGSSPKTMGRRRSETSALAVGGGLAALTQFSTAQSDPESSQLEGGKSPLGRRRSLQALVTTGNAASLLKQAVAPPTEGETVEDEEEAPKPALGRRRSLESLVAFGSQGARPLAPPSTSIGTDSTNSVNTVDSSSKRQGTSNQLGKRRLSANQIFGDKPIQRGNTAGLGRQQSIKDAVRRNSQADF